MIRFYSTQNKQVFVTLEEAVMRGLAEDTGLFMPEKISRMDSSILDTMHKLSFPELSFEVAKTILQDTFPSKDLLQIVEKAFTEISVPVKEIAKNMYVLELFHGPTLSFKDFGARFMAQLMSYFMRHRKKMLNILVATSGDTGSAIAHAFLNVPHVRVYILYPQNRVSSIQEQQLTTMGQNITALEIQGSFDDCQRLVKQAFLDQELRKNLLMSSANSINIARLIPQSFYYVYAYAQVARKKEPVVFSVPSGNFGNLTAGILAQKMGLPIKHFVAATNINDIVPKYLESGQFKPQASKQTLSNAMDVGNPSNFARLLDIFGDWKSMKQNLYGVSFTDIETEEVMREVFQKYHYLLDPHGAVAYLGLRSFFENKKIDGKGIFLETADPAKFKDDVERITGREVLMPPRLQNFLDKKKKSRLMSPDFDELKDYLMKNEKDS